MSRQRRGVRLAVAVCVVALCSAPVHSSARHQKTARASSSVAAEIVRLTNAERTHQRRTALRSNARLTRAAQMHADQMARIRRVAHTLPGAAYPQPEDRLAAAGYRWQIYGENVALGQSDAADVVDSWMHSHGHRANILERDFTEMGAGYAIDGAGRPYYVQVFAGPRP